jgi:hypothetical protein
MANWSHWDEKGGDRPSKAAAQDIQRIQANLPAFLQTYYDQLPLAAQAQLAADMATTPGYAELGSNLYGQYMPEYAQVGRDELAKDALSAAQTEYDIASGSGSDLAQLAMQLQRAEDQPYYDSRDLVARGMADFFSGQNPNALSGAERAEMEKTTARQVGYNPSAMNFAAGAMNTGQALQEKQSRFADNVAKMSSAVKPLQSGMDMTKIATGRSTQANPSIGAFQLPSTGQGQWAVQPANQYTSNLQNYTLQRNMLQGSAGDMAASMVGSFVGGVMCWVAQAAYGGPTARAADFANWLFLDAPDWFHAFYISAGEQIAEWVKVHATVRAGLRFVMNKITKQEGK